MDEVTFLRHLDNADRDLDSYPFWRVFKKACADNPIKGIKKNDSCNSSCDHIMGGQ